MSDKIIMFNCLMKNLDTCKNECKTLTEKLNMFDLNNIKEGLNLDGKRQAFINKIKEEKEYEKFYKEAILNLIKNGIN